MLPPPPRPTLFPYTTLFRSSTRGMSGGFDTRFSGKMSARNATRLAKNGRQASLACALALRAGLREHAGQGDRKSTRLNSSHMSISYAVFCLKKKKKKQRYTA